ncbi:Capsular polysaccharide ABC transporter, permease protein KpsM [Rhizobium freirei PRF 81]|uniref:Capsular polysaccharide ABC transporter, permease protein KpsM n=1 Tax=Rhizobium freirei PRF 81 TaxID=363754 RepID=N6UXY9_9HYPH|nr:Capsular polysaccharide ABC transporter, permease protein KpsM [Rhizobium freirei PRF 81]
MNAVMLRDMRTRFFNHGLGFLVQSVWPLVHMLVIMMMSVLTGRASPFGESPMLFFATGILPVLTFIYISRFMSLSLISNAPMMAFPVVHITDILFARALLEIIAGAITLLMMYLIFLSLDISPYPADPLQAVFAYLATILLAVGIGTIVSVISLAAPVFVTVYALLGIIFYISSGALFVPSELPDSVATPLSYNPLLQCVEWMRTAYYENYSDRLLNRGYVVGWGMCSLGLGLFLERALRGKLRDA